MESPKGPFIIGRKRRLGKVVFGKWDVETGTNQKKKVECKTQNPNQEKICSQQKRNPGTSAEGKRKGEVKKKNENVDTVGNCTGVNPGGCKNAPRGKGTRNTIQLAQRMPVG